MLAIAGGALRVVAGRSDHPASAGDWFDVRLEAAAPPFSGTVETFWFAEDLAAMRAALAELAGGPDGERELVIGGNRAAELRLTAQPAWPPTGDLAVRVWLTPSGDDPSVALQFDVFEPPAAFAAGLPALDRLLSN